MSKPTLLNKPSCQQQPDASMNESRSQQEEIPAENEPKLPWNDYRLPVYIHPISYDLLLHPNLDTGLFSGEVVIKTEVKQPTDHFIVHIQFLNITETELKTEAGSVISPKDTFPYPKNEYFVVTLEKPVVPGNYDLRFKFDGTLLNPGIVGFYKSEYLTETGQKRSIATSKFEPTYARRAYPCFDEPNFRAKFTTTLVHPKDYFALSNTLPESTTEFKDGLLKTKFATSVSMPTYLSCFIVCDFKYTEKKTQDGKPFRVYATPNQVAFTQTALGLGNEIQDFYASYFGIPYPLSKQDLIAIPDFISGAMEHWGLVTFRESNLLFNPNESSSTNEGRVASVVGHELAHMWFGNLVTMNWWDDLWLNEGFATYMAYIGVAAVRKSWHEEENILVADLQQVMIEDASINSHPIIQPVGHPDEITEIFDAISYSKGASVLRMLDSVMGTEDFSTGVKNYLKKYAFGNAKTIDLWNELSSASKKKLDIASIMDTWTKQMGFPVIHITQSQENPKEFTARQERFFLIPEHSKNVNSSESPYSYLWEVPLTYRQSNNTIETVWLHKETKKTFEIPSATTEVIKFNVDQSGYYKVNYEEKTWKEIIRILMNNHEKFSRPDRSHLLDDAFTLSNGGYLNYSIAFDLSKYLVNEKDYLPWMAVTGTFQSISNLLEETDAYPLFKKYMLDICSPLYEQLGWTDEGDHLTKQLRPAILGLLCQHGHQRCLQEASHELQSWISGQPIAPNLRQVVYQYGISNSASVNDWNVMWERYLATVSSQEKSKLLYGLAFTKDPGLLKKYLEYAKDSSKIRSQDYFTVLSYISRNPLGRSIIWDFVRQEWDYLVERFTLNNRYLGRLIPQITSSFSKEIRLQEITDFFKKYPEAGAGARAREKAVDKVKINISWLHRYKDVVKKWLEGNVTQ